MTKKKSVIIIGGGGAGLFSGAVVKQFANQYFDVTMISNEELFCRCSTPYVLTNKAKFKDTIIPDSMITQFGINLIKGVATSVDKKTQEVFYESILGVGRLKYDYLVIATGSSAIIPKIEGSNLNNVFSMRTADDLKGVNLELKKIKNAVVIGAGVIGVEMASALKENNIKTSLMLLDEKPFSKLADLEFQNLIEENLVNNKITILNNSSIKKIIGKNSVEKISYEKDNNLHELKCDLLIFATGVKSNTKLVEEIGVKTNNHGILVDDFLRTNIKNIYAAGDVAVTTNFVTKEKTLSQLATNAVIQGKIVGKNIIGMKTRYQGHTSAMILQFLKDEYGRCGISENEAKKKGIDYIVGYSHSTDIYQDLIASHQVLVKLIFRKRDLRIIGVQAYGRNLIWIINLISFAIQQNTKLTDLINLDYASHPSVSPWPFMDPIVDACENVLMQLQSKR